MEIVSGIEEFRQKLRVLRQGGQTVGFVPTMGYLHEGHLSLVQQAGNLTDAVVASIFVNPLQFNNQQDFEKYPANMERDADLLRSEGVSLVFAPAASSVYPSAHSTRVSVSGLTSRWEGEFRPGHFEGVTTVVSILFNLVQPDVAVFGEKDFQQLRVIEQMVGDLGWGIRIVRGETVRENDGLAMSSRNVRLSPAGRTIAPGIFRALSSAGEAFRNGENRGGKIEDVVRESLASAPQIEIEYVAAVHADTLEPASIIDREGRLLIAAYLEGVRLIDNVPLPAIGC